MDASVDHRLFTEEGHKQIEKDYEDTKGAATALVRPIDKRIEGFDNREADRAKEKIRSELAKNYSPEVVDYFIATGEESGWFNNLGKINEGFYKADDSSIGNLVNLSLEGIISNPKSPNQITPNTSSREAEVVVTAPKPATLGVAVVDTLGDVAHFVKGVPDNQKAAANDFYTLLTGGPIGFVTSKAVEKGMTLLPDPVLQTIASTSEKVTNIAGQAGTSVLVGVDFDKVKESQESGHEVTEDRVSGVGAVVVTVAGAATAGAAGVLIAKAKTPKIKNKNEGNDNPGKEDSEMVGQPENPNMDVLTKRKYDEILRLEKGKRPAPETYLSTEYVAKHRAFFDDGVVRIQPSAPEGKIGRTETWVLPKSVAEKMIAESKGNPRNLEKMLGLDENYLGNNPVLVEIHQAQGFRIPSGNEFAANEFWRPGGFTYPGGLPEAVIDPVLPGGYTTKPVF